jgi:glucose/mannose transport system permease protein
VHADHHGRTGRLFIYALLILCALYYLAPLYVMLTTSVKTLDEIRAGNLLDLPSGIHLQAWQKAWGAACTGVRCEGLAPYFWNSVKIAVPAVLISTMIGSVNGYTGTLEIPWLRNCVHRPDGWLFYSVSGCDSSDGTPAGAGRIIEYDHRSGAGAYRVRHRLHYSVLSQLLCQRTGRTGKSSTHRRRRLFRIYRSVILPLSLPIFMVCFIWQFTQIWNDFLFGVVFGGTDAQPVTVALNNLVNTSTGITEYNVNMAAAIIAALPTLILYMLAGKYFVRGLTAGAVKG